MDVCFIHYWTNESGSAQSFAYATHEEAMAHWQANGDAIGQCRGVTADQYNGRHDRLLPPAWPHVEGRALERY